MTRWARLTWQAADPARLAADLERWLLVEPVPQPAMAVAFSIRLGGSDLELVPWRREGPDDAPQAQGRLVLEPIVDGDRDRAAAEEVQAGPTGGISDPLTLAGLGWATVDLERAAEELGPWLRPEQPSPSPASGTDPHLGARTRVFGTDGLPGEVMVLAEPVTEGRAAASLARHGEGPCALYLRATAGLDRWLAEARARRVAVGPRRPGPLGPAAAVIDRSGGRGRMAGPHLIVVDRLGGASG